MPVDLRGIRVFIASPGGLDDERKSFRNVLTNFNEDDAHERGVAFIPVGWELTPAGRGRPQEKINEEVRTCDFMVLVLWDRWGSAPAKGGPYTSGTEEEYSVAIECIESTDHPMRDIIVMFKGVAPQQLSDPGAQLKKVLDFKARLEDEKALLFSTFDSAADFDRNLRKALLQWMREQDEEKKARSLPSSQPSEPRPEPEEVEGDSLVDEAERLADAGQLTRAESLFARAVVGRTDLGALRKYVRFLRRTGRMDQSEAVGDRLLELSRSHGDQAAETEALSNRAIIRRKRGDNAGSLRDLEAAIAIAESRGEDGLGDLAFLYDNVGLTLRKEGNFGAAAAMHERTLEIRRRTDDKRGLANASNNLGALLRQQGRLEEAGALHREAIDLFEGLDYSRGEAQARANLGEVLVRQGDNEGARSEYDKSLELNTTLNSPEGQCMNYWQLGRLELREGDDDSATDWVQKMLAVEENSSRPENLAGALHLWGQIESARELYPAAVMTLQDALVMYQSFGQRLGQAWTAVDLAKARALSDDLEGAYDAIKTADAASAGLGHVELSEALEEVNELLESLKALERRENEEPG